MNILLKLNCVEFLLLECCVQQQQNTWRSLVEVSIKPSIASWNESHEDWELEFWTNVLQSNCQSYSGSLAALPVIPKLLYSYKYLYREA